jgi:hypothetical protein
MREARCLYCGAYLGDGVKADTYCGRCRVIVEKESKDPWDPERGW